MPKKSEKTRQPDEIILATFRVKSGLWEQFKELAASKKSNASDLLNVFIETTINNGDIYISEETQETTEKKTSVSIPDIDSYIDDKIAASIQNIGNLSIQDIDDRIKSSLDSGVIGAAIAKSYENAMNQLSLLVDDISDLKHNLSVVRSQLAAEEKPEKLELPELPELPLTPFAQRWNNPHLEPDAIWVSWLYKVQTQGIILDPESEKIVQIDIERLYKIAKLGDQEKLDKKYNCLLSKQLYDNDSQARDYFASAYDFISSAVHFLLLDMNNQESGISSQESAPITDHQLPNSQQELIDFLGISNILEGEQYHQELLETSGIDAKIKDNLEHLKSLGIDFKQAQGATGYFNKVLKWLGYKGEKQSNTIKQSNGKGVNPYKAVKVV